MNPVQTLTELPHLAASGFGCPKPRHGLKLLHWFATECLYLDDDNKMHLNCEPEDGDYGFRPFENPPDHNGVPLLPDVELPYYEVGDLDTPEADELPGYIWSDYDSREHSSNSDRVLVSLDRVWFDRVYVTERLDGTCYNVSGTFSISSELILIIRSLSLDEFLSEAGF